MAKPSISADMLNLGLKQLGATKVKTHLSRVTVVKFDINPELTVSYFCHIKDEEKLYLQRIEPYPMRNYKFETVDNIVSFIKKDVEQFANASRSSNFKLFLDIIHNNYSIRRDLETLFLLNNVPHQALEHVLSSEQKNLEFINSIEHISLKNDPGSYPGEEVPYDDVFKTDKNIVSSSDAKLFYGESTKAPDNDILLEAVKEAVKEIVLELKDEIKNEIIRELKISIK